MPCNLKLLSLLAVAALAVSAVATSGASAASTFTSDIEETELTATPFVPLKHTHHVFDWAGFFTTCNAIGIDATLIGSESASITIRPTYSGCFFLGQTATIERNSCDYVLTADGTLHIGTDTGAGTGKTCAEDPMTFAVHAPPCTIQIGPQSISNAASYKTISPSGSITELSVEMHAKGFHYNAVGPGCTVTGTYADGNYTTGSTIITGEEPGTNKMVNLAWDA